MSQLIQKRLTTFITDQLIQQADFKLAAKEDLLGGGLVDSLGVMRLISFIEQTWQASVPPEEVTIENFGTVEAISSFLTGRGVE